MLEGNTDILGIPRSFFFLLFLRTHKLQLIYFESTDRTIAEGAFILDRAVRLLENLRTKGNMWYSLI